VHAVHRDVQPAAGPVRQVVHGDPVEPVLGVGGAHEQARDGRQQQVAAPLGRARGRRQVALPPLPAAPAAQHEQVEQAHGEQGEQRVAGALHG
jgi:hypothetical protein